MNRKEAEQSRREFLATIGADAAALIVPAAALIATPAALGQLCAPPGSTANPVRWVRDCRSIQPRRPASTLTSSETAKLKAAYKAMRDLAVTDPSDPRGFAHQTNIHCHNCGGGGSAIQIHFGDRFLPWHRAYLYFHEKILGALITDPNFRLPYWDWENPAHRRMPSAYTSPNNNTNPLFNAPRSMAPGDVLDPTDGQPATALAETTFADFSPEIEGSPHGSVHVEVGGDMSAFDTAAKDPVFYAHHGNIDKLWSDWTKADVTHTAPVTPAWLNQTQGFFDENKAWRTIRNGDVVDHEAKLRYIYAGRTWEFTKYLCIRDWLIVDQLQVRELNRFQLTQEGRQRLRPLLEKGEARLRLIGPQLPRDRSANYFLYHEERDAQANRGPESPSYLGLISVVKMHKEGSNQPAGSPRKLDFDLQGKLKGLLDRNGDFSLYIADRKQRGPNVAVSKLAVRGVEVIRGREA
jgi:polyphenol oxidase